MLLELLEGGVTGGLLGGYWCYWGPGGDQATAVSENWEVTGEVTGVSGGWGGMKLLQAARPGGLLLLLGAAGCYWAHWCQGHTRVVGGCRRSQCPRGCPLSPP